MAWRYHALNLRAGQWVHRDLPLRGVSLGPTLSGPFQLSGELVPDRPDLIGGDGEPILKEWGTLIVAEEEDTIRGGGIVTSTTNTGPRLNVDCSGFTAYPAGQPLVASLTWGGPTAGATGQGVDAATVARALWGHLQGLPGGNLGVEVDGAATRYMLGSWHNARRILEDGSLGPADDIAEPIPIDRIPEPGYRKPAAAQGKTVYWQYALHPHDGIDVGAKLEEIAKQAPFDWVEDYAWTDSAKSGVRLRLRLGAPRIGRRRQLRFVHGENITRYTPVERRGSEYSNVIVGRGAGEGTKQLTHTSAALPGDRLRRAKVLDRGDALSVAALRAATDEELGRSLHLTDITSFTASAVHPHAPLGSFEVGDDVLVRVGRGWRRFALWVRVLGIDFTPGGTEMSIACTRSDGFDYTGSAT